MKFALKQKLLHISCKIQVKISSAPEPRGPCLWTWAGPLGVGNARHGAPVPTPGERSSNGAERCPVGMWEPPALQRQRQRQAQDGQPTIDPPAAHNHPYDVNIQLTHPPTNSSTHPPTHSPSTHPPPHSSTPPPIHPSTHPSTHSYIHPHPPLHQSSKSLWSSARDAQLSGKAGTFKIFIQRMQNKDFWRLTSTSAIHLFAFSFLQER